MVMTRIHKTVGELNGKWSFRFCLSAAACFITVGFPIAAGGAWWVITSINDLRSKDEVRAMQFYQLQRDTDKLVAAMEKTTDQLSSFQRDITTMLATVPAISREAELARQKANAVSQHQDKLIERIKVLETREEIGRNSQ